MLIVAVHGMSLQCQNYPVFPRSQQSTSCLSLFILSYIPQIQSIYGIHFQINGEIPCSCLSASSCATSHSYATVAFIEPTPSHFTSDRRHVFRCYAHHSAYSRNNSTLTSIPRISCYYCTPTLHVLRLCLNP